MIEAERAGAARAVPGSATGGAALEGDPENARLAPSLGLTIGTRVEPRQVPLIFSLLVIPMTFLGAVYYPWKSLTPLPWLKWAVLINPLVYMSEGMRMALTRGIPHMAAWAIYGAIILGSLMVARFATSSSIPSCR